MVGADGARFATHRPDHWAQQLGNAVRDFGLYASWVHGLDASPHHEVIDERLVHGGHYELFLGPPGSAKSTRGRMFAEWALGRDPSFRWLILSEIVSGPATTWVTDMAATFEGERFRFLFGDLRGNSKEWSSRTLRFRQASNLDPKPPPWLEGVAGVSLLRGRRPGLSNPNLRAAGWRMGIQGVRVDGLIADDLVSDRSSNSRVMTQQIYSAFHQRHLSRLSHHPRERVFVFGQRFMPHDFYGLLMSNGVIVYDNNPKQDGMHVLNEAAEDA